jgi:hypothetical protein
MAFKNIFKSKLLLNYTKIFKQDGFKGVLKEGGWRMLMYFFLFYLIRDTILYILIPYLIIKGIIIN